MKEFKYIKKHNNYEFELNKLYKGFIYKKGWISIAGQLYREDYFEKIK